MQESKQSGENGRWCSSKIKFGSDVPVRSFHAGLQLAVATHWAALLFQKCLVFAVGQNCGYCHILRQEDGLSQVVSVGSTDSAFVTRAQAKAWQSHGSSIVNRAQATAWQKVTAHYVFSVRHVSQNVIRHVSHYVISDGLDMMTNHDVQKKLKSACRNWESLFLCFVPPKLWQNFFLHTLPPQRVGMNYLT